MLFDEPKITPPFAIGWPRLYLHVVYYETVGEAMDVYIWNLSV
jgi:hypothetical protein